MTNKELGLVHARLLGVCRYTMMMMMMMMMITALQRNTEHKREVIKRERE